MTWLELLTKVGEGKLPNVRTSAGKLGTVTVIKANDRHRGIGVNFPGLGYDTWYHEVNTGDRRSRYMDDLALTDDTHE